MEKKSRNHSKDFENQKMVLAQNIKKRRKELGLSQEELAHRVDIDRTYMSGIERGLRNPSLLVLCDLARELNIELEQLI